MNQVFVRFVPTWEVDPYTEEEKRREESLKKKRIVYEMLLSKAIELIDGDPQEHFLKLGQIYRYKGEDYMISKCPALFGQGERAHLLRITGGSVDLFPENFEEMNSWDNVYGKWMRQSGGGLLRVDGQTRFDISSPLVMSRVSVTVH